MSTPEGAFSVFPLAAAVTAPAGALSVFHHYRSSDCSPQERYLYFPTAAAVSAPAGALFIFPHCRSSARSSRSLLLPPTPQPNLVFFPHCRRSSARSRRSFLCISTIAAAVSTPEGAFSVFPLAAAVTAPAGALSVFHHYRCSDCSRRSAICIPSLPQQCSLQQEPSLPPPPPPPHQPSSSLPQQCLL